MHINVVWFQFSNTFSLCVAIAIVCTALFHVDVIIWNVHILIFTEWENMFAIALKQSENGHSNTSLWINHFTERERESAYSRHYVCLALGMCCIHTRNVTEWFKYMNETKWASRMYLNHKSFLGVNAAYSRVKIKFSTNEPIQPRLYVPEWFIHNGISSYPLSVFTWGINVFMYRMAFYPNCISLWSVQCLCSSTLACVCRLKTRKNP